MSTFYMDTSAIAKRYIAEVGTAWIQAVADPMAGHVLIVCELTPVEFVSILARRHREGKATQNNMIRLEANYQFHHVQEYLVSALDGNIMLLARQLLQRHLLRTLDAIHLACALDSGVSPIFVTADKHLLAAAAGEGLPTDNPLNHP